MNIDLELLAKQKLTLLHKIEIETNETVKEDLIGILHLLDGAQDEQEDKFPNGFDDWHETHFEIVGSMFTHMNQDEDAIPNILSLTETMQGLGGLYDLAHDWTTEFEQEHKGKQWGVDDETDYRGAIDEFLDKRYKN
jgi:hypothetical protein